MRDRKEKRKQRIVSADRRLSEHSSGFDKLAFKIPAGITMFKAEKDRTYRVSVVPFEVGKYNPFANPGDLYYERTYFTHPRIGPNNEVVVCSARTFKKNCAVCDFRARLAADPNPDPETKQQIKSLFPKERQLFLLYDHDDRKKGVQLFEVSNWCFGKHLDAKMQRALPADRERVRLFADPDKGCILHIGTREDTTGSFPFLMYSDIEFKPRKEPLPDEILDQAVCLDDLIKEPKYGDVKRLIESGVPDETEEKEDEDEVEQGEDDEQEEETDGGDEEDAESDQEGDDEDDEGAEDDEEEEESEPEIVKGTRVSYLRNGVRKFGRVTKVMPDDGKALVKIPGQEKPVSKDLEDLTVVEDEKEEDPDF